MFERWKEAGEHWRKRRREQRLGGCWAPRWDRRAGGRRDQQEDKNQGQGFPGGSVVESLPANAGDTGSSPGLGRSHMPRSNWAREPQLLSLRVWSLCSATREAATVKGPCTAVRSGPACRN